MRWIAPVDPECPEVSEFLEALFGDSLTAAMGAPTDEIVESFEIKHRGACARCQLFGAANIEVGE